MDSFAQSPDSVTTDLLKNCLPMDVAEKIGGPPIATRAQNNGQKPEFNRSSSLPEDILGADDENANNNANGEQTQDDLTIDCPPSPRRERRKTMPAHNGPVGLTNLAITDSTRRILESMSDNQVQDAKVELAHVRQRRRESGLLDMGGLNRKRLSMIMEGGDGENNDREGSFSSSAGRRRSSRLSGMIANKRDSVSDGSSGGGRRGSDESLDNGEKGSGRLSSSMVAMGSHVLEELRKELSDEEDEDEDFEGGTTLERRRRSKSTDAMATAIHELDSSEEDQDGRSPLFDGEKELQRMSRTLCQVKEVDFEGGGERVDKDIDDEADAGDDNEALEKIIRKHSAEPTSQLPRRRRERRQGMMSMSMNAAADQELRASAWKPLSANQHDPTQEELEAENEKEEKRAAAAASNEGGGFGGFWNKITSTFAAEKSFAEPVAQTNGKPQDDANAASKAKKEVNGATYFRRGKKKANKCQFLQAVALYNFALVRQREELGEDHIDCGTTLNEIGVCWMMLGERYPALTAFEEALYIRQKHLGDGAMEVAETTNNIWMILHEERCEMENLMEEGNEDD